MIRGSLRSFALRVHRNIPFIQFILLVNYSIRLRRVKEHKDRLFYVDISFLTIFAIESCQDFFLSICRHGVLQGSFNSSLAISVKRAAVCIGSNAVIFDILINKCVSNSCVYIICNLFVSISGKISSNTISIPYNISFNKFLIRCCPLCTHFYSFSSCRRIRRVDQIVAKRDTSAICPVKHKLIRGIFSCNCAIFAVILGYRRTGRMSNDTRSRFLSLSSIFFNSRRS